MPALKHLMQKAHLNENGDDTGPNKDFESMALNAIDVEIGEYDVGNNILGRLLLCLMW